MKNLCLTAVCAIKFQLLGKLCLRDICPGFLHNQQNKSCLQVAKEADLYYIHLRNRTTEFAKQTSSGASESYTDKLLV